MTDKNKLPMASIKASLDLSGDPRSSETDEKPFLFVIDKVSLSIESEDL